MKKTGLIALLLCTLFACRNNNTPDVSDIKVNLATYRFDQEFFSIDTNQLLPSLQHLGQQYPWFVTDYFQNILGTPPFSDTSTVPQQLTKQFLRDYQPIHAAASKTFADTRGIEASVKKGLQYAKHYFPDYKVPEKLIFYIGPLDAIFQNSLGSQADVITPAGLAIGLQLHLGQDFPLYNNEMGRMLYPAYISRRFTPAYIPVNCMKNIIDDIYPEQITGKPLIEQLVEKGKRLYVLDKLLPETADTLKIGYTKKQLQGCINNEGRIWNFFVTNSLLMNSDISLVKNYLNDAPNTPEFGEDSPGFIGLFTGWQIVKKYMDKHGDLSLPALLKTPAMNIYQESKYKPK